LVTGLGLRWGLSVLFVVCVGLYARQAIGEKAWQRKLGWSLHVVMALAMIAMAWPVGMRIPALLFVLVFTAAALYFVYFALFGPRIDHPVYHATMMGAMVVMAVVMQSAPMPGMTVTSTSPMGGHTMPMAGAAASAAGGASGSPAWAAVACGVLAAVFLIASLWSVVVVIRGPRRPYADLLMSLGMALAFSVIAI
jgi:hypothetical protein